MGQHHNPMDPRDPLSPAFYYLLVDEGASDPNRGRGGRPSGSGCGCLLLLLAVMLGLIISSLTFR
jgi:hypothetical protein